MRAKTERSELLGGAGSDQIAKVHDMRRPRRPFSSLPPSQCPHPIAERWKGRVDLYHKPKLMPHSGTLGKDPFLKACRFAARNIRRSMIVPDRFFLALSGFIVLYDKVSTLRQGQGRTSNLPTSGAVWRGSVDLCFQVLGSRDPVRRISETSWHTPHLFGRYCTSK
jgi:hypothetical protein